jgi:hypothetical protein
MPDYWIKAGLIALGLLTSIWIVASHGLAYHRTNWTHYRTLALAYLWMSVMMLALGYWFLTSNGRSPDLVNIFFVLLISLSRIATLWWRLDKDAQYRHPRDILLFRRPIMDEDAPDPQRGLHVPTAPAPPLSPRASRLIYLLAAIIGVVSILATIAFALLI